ncbi:hypothetical protein EDF87_101618 [Pseudomonas helmanticensis]|uniref:Uncharacterized protein n=1 Tax=Pseudomonas helmanticensis TaxID=1471381 RepID=A0A4V3FU20_9PSED|nr:hypothetical protein EDF87_101618 [Pseudomonas helmanticensis]
MAQDGSCTGCRCSLLRRDNDRENLRVILPRICRLPRPADNCHSNKYPLWVSAIDENARSLRPDDWRVNPQKEVSRGMWGMFRKGSGTECVVLLMAPSRAGSLPHFVLHTQNPLWERACSRKRCIRQRRFSWQSPTTDPPSSDAHGSCHGHTKNRQSRPRESATPTAVYRSDHGWPGRSPACRGRPCSARR